MHSRDLNSELVWYFFFFFFFFFKCRLATKRETYNCMLNLQSSHTILLAHHFTRVSIMAFSALLRPGLCGETPIHIQKLCIIYLLNLVLGHLDTLNLALSSTLRHLNTSKKNIKIFRRCTVKKFVVDTSKQRCQPLSLVFKWSKKVCSLNTVYNCLASRKIQYIKMYILYIWLF